MAEKVTKSTLADIIAKEMGLTAETAKGTVECIFTTIADSVKKGDEVSIHKFGTYTRVARKERMGINPKTMEKIKIAAKNAVKFKPAKTLKEHVA